MTIDPLHVINATTAKVLYLETQTAKTALAEWRFAIREARKLVGSALRESNFLSDIEGATLKNAGHSVVFRHLIAPPVSQDQFKLLCDSWSKGAENECRPSIPKAAKDTAAVVLERLDTALARWIVRGDKPTGKELRKLLGVVPALIAQQRVATAKRSSLAFEQEAAVVKILEATGWTRLPSKLIDTRAAVPRLHFMHKTRFATATTAHQEVDIACGLKGSYVLAMECKVTNDPTNSIKRINDVLKKASAWKQHWGSFVGTAALLQGIVAPKDVQRLTDAGVEVFWSHDLGAFEAWLASKI